MTAFVLGLPEHKVRVIAPDVGGGFGSKIYLYAEDVVVTWAAKQLNRPVKWTAERCESFVSDAHGRDHVTDRRAGDGQGRQVPRHAGEDDGEHGRLPVDLRLLHPDHPLRHAARRAVHHAGDLLRGDRGVHQHHAGRRVPRRRPPGSDLRGGAPGGDRGARDEARPGRDPPAQLHPQLPVPDAGRAAVRHRQLRRDPGRRR